MVNIAVCFSGRITGYEECFKYIKNLKDSYNPVFFCSLDKDELTPYNQKLFKELNIEFYNLEKLKLPDWLESEHLSGDFKNVPFKKYPGSRPNNIYNMWYHNKRCVDLVKEYQVKYNMKFDVVIRTRADILYFKTPDIYIPQKNTIYIMHKDNETEPLCIVKDEVFYGDLETMSRVCELYKYMYSLCEAGIIFHPEYLFYVFINFLKLNIIKFPEFWRGVSGKRCDQEPTESPLLE
jgi:hypothetical protein